MWTVTRSAGPPYSTLSVVRARRFNSPCWRIYDHVAGCTSTVAIRHRYDAALLGRQQHDNQLPQSSSCLRHSSAHTAMTGAIVVFASIQMRPLYELLLGSCRMGAW